MEHPVAMHPARRELAAVGVQRQLAVDRDTRQCTSQAPVSATADDPELLILCRRVRPRQSRWSLLEPVLWLLR
jgi:hypothetical protein